MKQNILRTIILINIIFLLSNITSAQKIQSKNFRSPVDFPITLSGNFAELRNNHFHSGIDIRTFTIGKKIYSVADGFISRIKISPFGYGRAIYIDHPNGYTTVYGHLNRFNKKIENFITNKQYKNKSFAIDINLKKDVLNVKKSEIIAFSGNSGSSAGPHLHYEIRETASEYPINPLVNDIKVKDTRKPKIRKLHIYPIDQYSSINGKNIKKSYSVIMGKYGYFLKGNPQILVNGNIGFALETNDYLNNTNAKCGVYNIKTIVNDSMVSEIEFNKFSFANTRYINTHMDYALNKRYRKRIHKTYKEKNDKLCIYKNMQNRGIIYFDTKKLNKIKFICTDVKGNQAKLNIKITGTDKKANYIAKECTQLMHYNEENTYTNDEIEIKIKPNSLYKNLQFNYSKTISNKYKSDIHNISTYTIGVQKHYSIKIKTKDISDKNISKAGIYLLRNKRLYYKGGLYIKPYIISKTNEFGSYVVAIDSISPIIKPYTKYNNMNLKARKTLSFKISDSMSGIKSYKGTIDDKWVLFVYDAKKQHLYYKFDKKRIIPNKKHILELTIKDRAGNKKSYKANFTW